MKTKIGDKLLHKLAFDLAGDGRLFIISEIEYSKNSDYSDFSQYTLRWENKETNEFIEIKVSEIDVSKHFYLPFEIRKIKLEKLNL